MSNYFNLGKVERGGSGQDVIDKINDPIKKAEDALNTLAGQIADTSSKSSVIYRHAPLSSDIFIGALVYFDTTSCKFTPAVAGVQLNPVNSSPVELEASRVEGMVVDVDNDTNGSVAPQTGTILLQGFWRSAECVTNCLGANPVPGTYYLSQSLPGRATRENGSGLRQPVLTCYGSEGSGTQGVYDFRLGSTYQAHDSHFHAAAVLKDDWVSASAVEGVTPPTGALFAYLVSEDSACADLGEIVQGSTAVFYNGVLDNPDSGSFVIDSGILWCKLAAAPASGSVTVYNCYPIAYGYPVVRSVQSTNGFITATQYNGVVKLTAGDFGVGTITHQAHAVTGIDGKNLLMTPVVSEIQPSLGITLVKGSNGVVTIAASNQVGFPVDAYSINHNGTNYASDGNYTYLLFPRGRDSGFVMACPVSGNMTSGGTASSLKAWAWATLTGSGATFDVAYRWVPLTTSGTSSIPTEATGTSELSFASVAENYQGYKESSDPITIDGDGMLYVSIKIQSTPNVDVKMLRAGVRFELVAAETEATPQGGTIVAMQAVVNEMAKGSSTIPVYSAVRASNGALELCTSSTAAHCDKCIGITITDNAATIKFVSAGVIEKPDWNLTPGEAVYVGTDGSITQTDPDGVEGALYIQRIGTALSSTRLLVNIRSGIMK